nr:uncharacterized protein LOC109184184 [Ipomoea batatas]
MSNSDSQTASAQDYDGVVDVTPTNISFANSTISPRESREVGLTSKHQGKGNRMVLKKGFATTSTKPKNPRPKVSLVGNKAIHLSTPTTEQSVPTAFPLETAQTTTSATDLQVARAPSKWGKDNAADSDVEKVTPSRGTNAPAL